ncbi:hypothetical protein [Acinetobacter ursingii]|uniref:hypothetical protein n=1 Tax=Acinetobacter ursingii TaxID=108980 RepID=UPI001D18FC70|nr:hypothetical protein [Acinetobacter ursingii]
MSKVIMQLHPFIFVVFIASILLDILFLFFAIFTANTLFAFMAILLLVAGWLIFEEHRLNFELWD